MSTTKKINFFNSITTKITSLLLLAFMLVIAVVIYIVNSEGFDKIRQETNKLIVQQGEKAVAAISFDIASVMRSNAQLKDTSEVLPLTEEAFQQTLDRVFNEKSYTLLGSGGIWPAEFKLDPDVEAYPMVRLRQDNGGYTNVAKNNAVTNYLNQGWFKVIETSRPETCLWNHVQASQTANELAMSCALAVERENEFWGATSVNFTLDSIDAVMDTLSDEIGEGYAILVDNSNQIVASSDTARVPYIDEATGKPILLDAYIETHPAFAPVVTAIEQDRQQLQQIAQQDLSPELASALNQFDDMQNTKNGSMLINYVASLSQNNPQRAITENTFLGSYKLTNDRIYNTDSQAYVFTIPETLWKLIIVKSDRDVNAIATNLSNNLIKYLVFILVGTAAVIFLLLDFIAFRPLSQITQSINDAEELIDSNKYNELEDVQFYHTTNDEIGMVNKSLKQLFDHIARNEGQLANINQQLETKVKERTAELQDAMVELKNSQVQLIRSEKMATLGQMVAGVAHEVNTPLSYVQNNLEIINELTEQYEEVIAMVGELKTTMLDDSSADEDIENLMNDIIAASTEIEEDDLSEELRELIKDSLFGVEQITEMVLNLRNFARIDESKVKQVDIKECINSSLKIARNSIKHYDIVTDLKDIPEITCSPSQINQVLINLINNAAHAIDDNPDGKISIATGSDSENIFIDIKDNGHGMSEEVMNKIFEPFFTTKAAGKGTGLGMAISQQIIEQHGGVIKVKSVEGKGTMFRIVLPIDSDLVT